MSAYLGDILVIDRHYVAIHTAAKKINKKNKVQKDQAQYVVCSLHWAIGASFIVFEVTVGEKYGQK